MGLPVGCASVIVEVKMVMNTTQSDALIVYLIVGLVKLQCTNLTRVKQEILWLNVIRVNIGYSTANNTSDGGYKK
jgi:hypothetical protein